MQKWEYLHVSLNSKQMAASARINGGSYPIPNKAFLGGAELSSFTAYLGEEGWELAATLSGYVPSVLIFKRPKP